MSWQLINCKKAWQLGPATTARLKREEAALRAMGNISGANVLAGQIETREAQWDAYKTKHEPAPLPAFKHGKPLTKIDTQGL